MAESREGSVPDLAQAFAQCWRQNTEHAGGQDLVAFAAAHGVFDEELDGFRQAGGLFEQSKGVVPPCSRARDGWLAFDGALENRHGKHSTLVVADRVVDHGMQLANITREGVIRQQEPKMWRRSRLRFSQGPGSVVEEVFQ